MPYFTPTNFLGYLCIVSFFFCVNVESSVMTIQPSMIDITPFLITEDNKPTTPLRRLFFLDGITGADKLETIIEVTQKRWIGVQQGIDGKERADLVDNLLQRQHKESFINIGKEIGIFEEAKPRASHYAYGVCLGAFLEGVRDRVSLMVESWKRGVRFDKLIFLTGERLLRNGPGEKDDPKLLNDVKKSPLPFRKNWKGIAGRPYQTEYDMVKLVWEQVELPPGMREALNDKVIFINATGKNGNRPTTRDTYATWLKQEQPQPGTIITFSSPMLCYYQQLVAKNVLGNSYPIETIGRRADPEKIRVSVFLDTVAKCLYEIGLQRGIVQARL